MGPLTFVACLFDWRALLGGLSATDVSGESLRLPTRKARALLAYLALPPGVPHSRDTLAALLWGHTTDARARNSLRQCVFGMRRVLHASRGEILIQEGETLRLDPDAVGVDVVDLERCVGQGTRAALEEAGNLYVGDLLEGFGLAEPAFEEWLAAERNRVRELALDGLGYLLVLQAGAGAGQEAIHTGIRLLLRLDPLQEAAHRTLMRLYAQRGRRSDALRQYQTCADVLTRELGVAPESATERLRDEILRLDATRPRGRASRSAPVAALPSDPPAILVVEDEPPTRAMLEGMLVAAGYDVVVATDGSAALRQLAQRSFDLVLSDVRMPEVDGFTLPEAMTRDGLTTPAMFVSSRTDAKLEARGLALGAWDYVRKPISKAVLLLRVENLLRRRP